MILWSVDYLSKVVRVWYWIFQDYEPHPHAPLLLGEGLG